MPQPTAAGGGGGATVLHSSPLSTLGDSIETLGAHAKRSLKRVGTIAFTFGGDLGDGGEAREGGGRRT